MKMKLKNDEEKLLVIIVPIIGLSILLTTDFDGLIDKGVSI